MNHKLTCIVPCYKRPKRTLRLLSCIMEQKFKGFEAIFIGDGCREFQELLDKNIFDSWIKIANKERNTLKFINLPEHKGGYGAYAREKGIEMATGHYTIFVDNDDTITPDHFQNYYSIVKDNPRVDMGYFNTYIHPMEYTRNAELNHGSVGHAEIIVRTELLQRVYQPFPEYGHDWTLIEALVREGAFVLKSNNPPTYWIRGVPHRRELIED